MVKYGIILFNNQNELDNHIKTHLEQFRDALKDLNYDIPRFSKFVPYKDREEYSWLYCDSCKIYLGEYKDGENLFWCPNCNLIGGDGIADVVGYPARLCLNCTTSNIVSDNMLSGHPLPDGRKIDYFIHLEEKELEQWIPILKKAEIPEIFL